MSDVIEPAEPLYVIHWRSNRTGATGNGTGGFPFADAKKYARAMDQDYFWFGLCHWIEPAEAANEKSPEANQGLGAGKDVDHGR